MENIQQIWNEALKSTEERTMKNLEQQGENISEEKIPRIVLLTFLEELTSKIPDVDHNDLRDLIEKIRAGQGPTL